MTTSRTTRTLQIALLSVLFTGCAELFAPHPHSHETYLGTIDLSAKQSKCEGVFRWNSHGPGLELVLLSTTRPAGSRPDSLAIQVEVFDTSDGRLVSSRYITREHIVFGHWNAHKTYLAPDDSQLFETLQAGHSYRFVVTVLQEEDNLGSAKVYMGWVTGGDSM
jgi:hypothetical protein